MYRIFSGRKEATTFNGDISGFDTGHVMDMALIFDSSFFGSVLRSVYNSVQLQIYI